MTKIETLKMRIAGLRARIRYLEEGLPYADHGAYSQDINRMENALEEIRELEAEIMRETILDGH